MVSFVVHWSIKLSKSVISGLKKSKLLFYLKWEKNGLGQKHLCTRTISTVRVKFNTLLLSTHFKQLQEESLKNVRLEWIVL